MKHLNENSLAEQPVIDWLKELGYDYEYGPDLAPGGALQERQSFRQVVLLPRLQRSLTRLNPQLQGGLTDEPIRQLLEVLDNPDPVAANRAAYRLLTEGGRVRLFDKDGQENWMGVRFFDFDDPLNNEFLVVNQFAVQGAEAVRRPDVVVLVNGIPLAVFELKNPTSDDATIESAYQQLQDYKKVIPDIFAYNQVLVVSDLLTARHGTISSAWERFSPWKGIESENEKPGKESQLETLVKGIFHKARLLDIIRNFIVYEADADQDATTFNKKMCLYHQYFGVNKAVDQTLRAAAPNGDRKIGVFWHTQGSGKSLSMVFYVNKAKRLAQLASPTFLFLTDRRDLDGQLHKTFLRTGYPQAWQAPSVSELKARLRTAGGEILFTTIQKFETEREQLSDRENIIVVADEAHRSQYATFAGNVRDALPKASFMGITGTPINLLNKSTELVFGPSISVYQINRAVEDGATVPIYYEGRLVPLHLTNEFIDDEFEDIVEGEPIPEREGLKKKWARLVELVGSPERVAKIGEDIIRHFSQRGLEGKGMVVAISRRTAVDLYQVMRNLPDAPEMAVVVSSPEEFVGRIQEETRAKELEKRFKNPTDPLKLVIVCDMWLTGFDVPSLHTMYLDKPLKNHSLMQAIARVNRVFRDKPGGLIVDYIGIADDLKKALSIYSADIRKEAMVPLDEVIAKMLEKYDIVQAMFTGVAVEGWRKLAGGDLARLFQEAINAIITDPRGGGLDEGRKRSFLKESELLFRLHALVMPHAEANRIRDEVAFSQAVKKALTKVTVVGPTGSSSHIETAIRELISQSVAAEGVIDIFVMKGKGQADISIFDEKFLEEVKNMRLKNLAVETLRKLLRDELRTRMRKNLVRYTTLMELLEKIIEEYENNIINSTKVIERLIELARDIKKAEAAGKEHGLDEEEQAFYDAISVSTKTELKNGELKEVVRELVRLIKRDLTVDWTNNEVIKARIRANVHLLLLRNRVPAEQGEFLLEPIFKQAALLYGDYVPGGKYVVL